MAIQIKKIDALEEKSDIVQEVLEKKPEWIIRWGTMYVFLVVLVLFLFCWMIEYPDVITCRITLVRTNAPLQVIAKGSGQFNFLVPDNTELKRNDVIGYFSNAVDYRDVNIAKQLTESVMKLYQDEREALPELHNLGSLQNYYNDFKEAVRVYQFNALNKPQTAEIRSAELRFKNLEQLNEILTEKLHTANRNLELAKADFKRDQRLFEEKVIAQKDFEIEEKELLNARSNYENVKLEQSRNRLAMTELSGMITKLQTANSQTGQDLVSRIENSAKRLRSEVDAWEDRYVIKSPTQGTVSYHNYWLNNQFVQEGVEIVSIVPRDSSEIIGRAESPVYNSGKIKVGQKVNVLLDSYPYQEFGILSGRVENISQVPRQNTYLIRVSLPAGMRTTYDTQIEFTQQMTGIAEIVTDDINLLQRIFYSLRSIARRNTQVQ